MTKLLVILIVATPTLARAQACPIDPARGYPVSAHSTSAPVDSTFLTSVARAAAYRWRVPSKRRNSYFGWQHVERRIVPPEPRWADDWAPKASHTGAVRLVLSRDGNVRFTEILKKSGDKLFDSSLRSIADEPMPGAPPFPTIPGTVTGDTISITLTFGEVVTEGQNGVVRFAAVQTRAELVPLTLEVLPPLGHRGTFPSTTIKYDVTEHGTVDLGSIEILRSAGPAFDTAVRRGLERARFKPPTSNCRPVSQSVVQTFGG